MIIIVSCVLKLLCQFIWRHWVSQSLLRPNWPQSLSGSLSPTVRTLGTRTLWGDLSCFTGLNVALGCPPATELSNLALLASVGQWPTARISQFLPHSVPVLASPVHLCSPHPPPPTLLSSNVLFSQPDCASHFGFCTSTLSRKHGEIDHCQVNWSFRYRDRGANSGRWTFVDLRKTAIRFYGTTCI